MKRLFFLCKYTIVYVRKRKTVGVDIIRPQKGFPEGRLLLEEKLRRRR